MSLIFEWDARKARENLRKHRISFEEARTIFFDPMLLTFPDEEHSSAEERFVSVGSSARDRILLVIHTEHYETENEIVIRLISSRKATATERKSYEEA
jgi:uncharacterized protein